MRLVDFFKKKTSSDIAKDRLKLVLISDRASCSPEIMERIKNDIINVLQKYVEIDQSGLDIKITQMDQEGEGEGHRAGQRDVQPHVQVRLGALPAAGVAVHHAAGQAALPEARYQHVRGVPVGLPDVQDHRLAQVLQHEAQRGGGESHRIGAVQHDEAVIEAVV